ncbi:hypothetical protein QAD02_009364 [Eretmocerus hayati]|uniref:Uncharacterized protein n=1 Tax=Eretmocerus hayati TaxID=131215 RepID=A0ACC2N9G9_9HYME|nr:hypothetical protein QAD02_009364 [Eretmocerus hayati]
MDYNPVPSDEMESVTVVADVVEIEGPYIEPVVSTATTSPISTSPIQPRNFPINDETHEPSKVLQPQSNSQVPAVVATRIVPSVVPKPNYLLRKMSTMMEEDSSDDLDNNCPNR